MFREIFILRQWKQVDIDKIRVELLLDDIVQKQFLSPILKLDIYSQRERHEEPATSLYLYRKAHALLSVRVGVPIHRLERLVSFRSL